MNKAATPLADILRLTPRQGEALERLGQETVFDLLHYWPNRYLEPAPTKTIAELHAGETATIYAQVLKARISKSWKSRVPLGEMTVIDPSGQLQVVWFHQPYLAKKVPLGNYVRLQGKVAERKGSLYLANPEIEPSASGTSPSLFGRPADPAAWLAIYPERYGLSSLWFRHAIGKLLQADRHQDLTDPLPVAILEKYHLPPLSSALVWIHQPRSLNNAIAAKKRFAFQEIFLIQLSRLNAKREYRVRLAAAITTARAKVGEFSARFPFPLTGAQQRAINQITQDLGRPTPMMRLLEGDVGSGKTAVAAATAYAVVQSGGEVAYMAPTEILARQHFASFIEQFRHLPVNIGLLTGAECRKFPSKIDPTGHTKISRNQLLKWVANGEIPILIGTHALIQKTVRFKNLAYVIIDEQHRFGVNQRAGLIKPNNNRAPHLLSMTATPIPRTLALTIYGDLDLSLLDELPAGRKNIITKIVTESERGRAYEEIRAQLKLGRQVYVICPRIDEPDPAKELALQTKSAKAEQKRLQEKIFPDFRVGLIHSKLKPKDKEAEMVAFAAGEINVLVATSVVEVGVNVPNATLMVIEGAERFGLAQLHQLRGRVQRSSEQAYCFLFTSTAGSINNQRLKALQTAKNGFELAELDLKLRGAGALAGGQQWGLSDLAMEGIQNLKMVEAARTEAQNLLAADPDLTAYPQIKQKLDHQKNPIHFE